jgi:hypothetical protein
MRTIDRINRALRGTGYRLHRNLRGGSYYYLSSDGAKVPVECSIYCYSLGPTDSDFNFAAYEINDAFRRELLPPPIAYVNK